MSAREKGPNRSAEKSAFRVWLENEYLPRIDKGRCLFVGVADYTQHYHTLVPDPENFMTLDMDPAKARFGSPFGHAVSEISRFKPAQPYQTVVLTSLFGYKGAWTNSLKRAKKTTTLALDWVQPGGELLFAPGFTEIRLVDWRDFVRSPVFSEFDRVFENAKGINYIWIGKKRDST